MFDEWISALSEILYIDLLALLIYDENVYVVVKFVVKSLIMLHVEGRFKYISSVLCHCIILE